jgi:hypothetical protein
MASRFQDPDVFTTATINAGASLVINHTIPSHSIDLYKIKVVPSAGSGPSIFEIYQKGSAGASDKVYGTKAFAGNLIDPVEDQGGGVVVERNEGFIIPYFDVDESLALHIKITNQDTVAKTYTVTLIYELATAASFGGGVPEDLKVSGLAAGLAITGIVKAGRNTDTIFQGDFRALYVAPGGTFPPFVDMRTAAEGGTFPTTSDATHIYAAGIFALPAGAQYLFNSASPGRWYIAFRLKNTYGNSN